MKRHHLFVLVGTLLVLIIGVGAWWRRRGATHVQYVTAPVSRGLVARAVTASGTVNPVTTVQVGTYVSGVIQQLFCDYNTQVTKGQMCAKIDPRPYQTVVDQEQSNLAAARAQLTKDQADLVYAKLSYDRMGNLVKSDYVTQDSFDHAKASYDQAVAQLQLDQATIQQHQAVLQAAMVNLGYTNIVSPVKGTVVSRNVTMGQTVAASFQTPTLFVIATDLTEMEVDANVSESDIGSLTAGAQASFTVEAFPDRRFLGTVVQVRQAPQSVQNVVTYDVVISVANPGLMLKPGMTATCQIIVARHDRVLRVPDVALRYTPGGIPRTPHADASHRRQIWVLRRGTPAAVPVTIGLDDDTDAEILAGAVQLGDQVIVSEQRAATSSVVPRLTRF
jgi:HlyD family secretion protein